MKPYFVLFCTILVVVCYIFFTPFVYAANGGLEVNPAFSNVTMTKDEAGKSFDLFYINHSQKPITLKITLFNYRQQSISGTTQLFDKDTKNDGYSLLSHATVQPETLTLNPGEKGKVTVNVTNDANLSPGGHYAATVAEVVSDVESDSNTSVVSSAVSSLILFRKEGGERFSYILKNVDWPKDKVDFQQPKEVNMLFENKGNTHIIPYGRIEVYDSFKRLIYKGIVNTSSSFVLPGVERTLPSSLYKVENMWPISFNHVVINVTDSLRTASFKYDTYYTYVNVPVLLLSVFVIIVLILAIIKLIKRK